MKKLKAIFEGKLKIGDLELNVAVLDDKTRIVKTSDVFKALDRPVRGTTRIMEIPTFMDAKNLQPFISDDLRNAIKKVRYLDKNQKEQQGYNAKIL
ncbi:MAG: hypothetical protein JJV97_05335 [SAR324 cluster bacterium]|nr:hypothetical protein [SAR324 cluster bacterium]